MKIGKDWDIELTNDPERIAEKLEEGSQLCAVFNRSLDPKVLFAYIRKHYVYYVNIDGEDRYILLYGATKEYTDEDKSMQKKLGDYQGEVVTDIIESEGTPYLLIDQHVPDEFLKSLKTVFEVKHVQYDGNNRLGFRCFYFDVYEHLSVSNQPQIVDQFVTQN